VTNLDNTIVGAGSMGDGSTPLILINGGTINANTANALVIDVPEPITNSGIMEATGTGGLFISTNNGLNNNGGKIEAIGTRATVVVDAFTMPNISGLIFASGANAHIALNNTTVSGGSLKTTGIGASIDTLGSILSGVTISAGSLVTLGSTTSNTLQLYGNIRNGGTILVSGGTGFNFLGVGTVTLSGGARSRSLPAAPATALLLKAMAPY
jgi:filamentous hemagglutinin